MNMTKLRVGVFATGLDTYWGQFEGLLDHLNSYREEIVAGIYRRVDAEVVDAGMVDNPDRAACAAELFREKGVDVVFLYVATYCLSSTILPVARALDCPLVLLNLQPVPAIDYNSVNALGDKEKMTGVWLEHCQACSIPEICNVLKRASLRYSVVTGYLADDKAWNEIEGWLRAASAVRALSQNRMGVLGHYYSGMLDIYTDLTKLSSVFGTHFDMLEMCELKTIRNSLKSGEIAERVRLFGQKFDVSGDCPRTELERAAATSLAMDRLVEKYALGSMAYYYEGEGELNDIATSVIAGNTLLTGRGIPVAGECDVKTAQAMKILSLIGGGGSFSEFYALDFKDDVVLLGHDGPAHPLIADGRVALVPLPVYHGKPGRGLSIQMSVRRGPVTLLSVCETPDGVHLLAAEGEAVAGPVLNIGNTNSRYRFGCGAGEFIGRWSEGGTSHHCAVGVGKLLDIIEKIAFLLDIRIVKV